ncbi:MAG: LipL45-related lipoprotein [Parcubacteria group bacterium Gr01-1014_33]|nr:MAG: LipL45-related lipoprotein [Parcubacteria group bacterium Gr01-1014_33]
MVKLYIIVIAALAAIAGASLFFAARPPASEPVPDGNSSAVSLPWIEVVAPHVFEINRQSQAVIRELRTGDELASGTSVKTGTDGRAHIYFPDGSVIRLDLDTKVVITEAVFNPARATLVVRIALEAGRVWSKIFELATPDSLWEVKTNNAVATVRGTAFDMLYRNGVTQILGSENTVSVYVGDEAGEPIVATEGRLAPDTVIVISEKERDAFKVKPSPLVPEPASEAVLEETWVNGNKGEDREFNQEIEELRREVPDDAELRKKFRDILRQKFDRAEEDKNGGGTSSEAIPALPGGEQMEKTGSGGLEIRESAGHNKESGAGISSPKPVDTNASKQVSPARVESSLADSILTPKTLSLRAVRTFNQVVEGDEITFQAILLMSDKSTRDVTEKAEWRVIGPIGRIARPGVFTAKLDASIAEFGSASGSIVAVWKDPASGKEFLGATPIFKVEAHVEKTLEERG